MPAYRRLTADARRETLLALGVELFTEHAYDELSMTDIARAAGISKAALYHYFRSKEEFFVATLVAATADVQALVDAHPDLPARERVELGLDLYLGWIDEHRAAYAKLIRSIHAAEEIRAVVDTVRTATAARIAEALADGEPTPEMLTALAGWLWFIDGACLDWIGGRDVTRDQLKALLLGALDGALRVGPGA